LDDDDISKDKPAGSQVKTLVNKTCQGSIIGARIVSTELEQNDAWD